MGNQNQNLNSLTYEEWSYSEAKKLKDRLSLLILTATEIETKTLHREMSPLPDHYNLMKVPHKNQTYYIGLFGVYGSIHAQCEMGSISRGGSITTASEAIDIWKPKAVIMCGIAFGINKRKQKIGDVLVSKAIIPYNILKESKEKKIYRNPIPEAGYLLFNRFKNAKDWHHNLPGNKKAKIIPDFIFSGESLIDNIEYRDALLKTFPNAKGGEMEGVGLYAAAETKGLQWIVVKGICDYADGSKSRNKPKNQKIAVESSISLCKKVLSTSSGFKELGFVPINREKKSPTVHDYPRIEPGQPPSLGPSSIPNFKNRIREIKKLQDYFNEKHVRLICVTGRSGMGKTALVNRVLMGLGGYITDQKEKSVIVKILYFSARSTGLGLGQLFDNLIRVIDDSTANVLKVYWADEEISIFQKVEYFLVEMQKGNYVIVLDSLEKQLDDDGNVKEEGLRLFIELCSTGGKNVIIIVTSQRDIKISPAALSFVRHIRLQEGLPEDDAISMLHDLDPEGELKMRDAPAEVLKNAVKFAAGIPRGLEIIAYFLFEYPTATLAKLLEDKYELKNQVLEMLVSEGYSKISEKDKKVMGALAVFKRPVDCKAVTHMLEPWLAEPEVHICLKNLVKSHFVKANRGSDEYWIHDIDLEYAYKKIPTSSLEDKNAYNMYNLELRAAEYYSIRRKPENQWQSRDDLMPQLFECEHRINAGDYDNACCVVKSIDERYLRRWGYYEDIIKLRERLLDNLIEKHLIASNLANIGRLYGIRGQIDIAIKYLEKAFDIIRKIGDELEEVKYLDYMGLVYIDLSRFQDAVDIYEQAIKLAQSIDDHRNECICLGRLGVVKRCLGYVESGIKCQEKALEIAIKHNYRDREGVELGGLGTSYRDLGCFEKAIIYYEEALAIAREVHDRRREGIWLGFLSIIYRYTGQFDILKKSCEQAHRISETIHDRRHGNIWRGNLAMAYYIEGNFEKAIELHEEALKINRQLDDPRSLSYNLIGLSRVRLATGETSKVRELCEEAVRLNVPETRFIALLILGIVLLHLEKPIAKRVFDETISCCKSMLDKTSNLFQPLYTLATAMVGCAVCDPGWMKEERRAELITLPLKKYQQAFNNCSAQGVVLDSLNDLKMIKNAVVTGLEPVIRLLESRLSINAEEEII